MTATEPNELESWRRVWRDGIAPLLSTAGLTALRDALATDDQRLGQGRAVFPNGIFSPDHPPEWACAVGFCVWHGEQARTARRVHDDYRDVIRRADFDVTTAHFLNWFDMNPRAEVFVVLLPEVDRELARRTEPPATAA